MDSVQKKVIKQVMVIQTSMQFITYNFILISLLETGDTYRIFIIKSRGTIRNILEMGGYFQKFDLYQPPMQLYNNKIVYLHTAPTLIRNRLLMMTIRYIGGVRWHLKFLLTHNCFCPNKIPYCPQKPDLHFFYLLGIENTVQ